MKTEFRELKSICVFNNMTQSVVIKCEWISNIYRFINRLHSILILIKKSGCIILLFISYNTRNSKSIFFCAIQFFDQFLRIVERHEVCSQICYNLTVFRVLRKVK